MTRHLLWAGLAAILGLAVFAAAYVVGAAIGLAVVAALIVTVLGAIVMGGWKSIRARASGKASPHRG